VLFALLPGAGCEPWIWHRVVPELQQRGHDAIGVRLPYDDQRAGLSEYADAVASAIGAREDVALVAQSIAGFVAPLVCTRLPVRLLALVNAMIPLPGETAGGWWEHVDHASALAPVVAEHGPLESWDAAAQVAVFLNDVEPALAAESANHVGPPGAGIFSSPLAIDAWPDVSARALAGRRDRFFPLEFQRRVARERLQLELDEIDSGHSPMLARPAELAARLAAYADEL
jgi:pimeloyl-ACP methyl ester carboxylesterase